MKQLIFIWTCFVAAIFCFSQSEHVSAFWQSRDSNYNKNVVSGGGGGFTGAGDVVSGALAWYSPARAYNAAYATGTGNLADIVDTATGLAACTIKAKTNGFADLTSTVCPTGSPTVSVTTFCTVTHAAGCSITKLYDQSGAAGCSGISCDATQSTLANMPKLTLSALNSLPCLFGVSASSTQLLSPNINGQTQPISHSAVVERTSNFSAAGSYIGTTGGGTGMLSNFGTPANTAGWYAGTQQSASATDSAFHAIQTIFNGASSLAYIDGSLTGPVNVGSDTMSGSHVIIANDPFGDFLDGLVCEVGIWGVGFSSGQYSGLNSNQHGANSYAF